MTFGLDLDPEMLSEALEAYVRVVAVVVVLGVWELRETVLRNVLGAYNAWFPRNCYSLARCWLLAGVVVVVLAFAFDANERSCCGGLTAWRQCEIGIGCHDCRVVKRLKLGGCRE